MDKVNAQDVSTSDIVLASYLKCKGVKLERIDKVGNRGVFIFSQVDSALLEEFDLGQALVEPVALSGAIKSLTTATRRIA